MKLRPKTLLPALMLFILAGCCAEDGPWPMPSGYTYHNELYKAPPGPEAEDPFKKWGGMGRPMAADGGTIGVGRGVPPGDLSLLDSQTVTRVVQTDEDWLAAAGHLLDQMIVNLGVLMEPVWLEPVPGIAPPHAAAFHAALQAGLQNREMVLAPRPGDGPFTLRFNAAPASGGPGSMLMTIDLLTSRLIPTADEGGVYHLGEEPPPVPAPSMPALTAPGGAPVGAPIPIVPMGVHNP